MITSVSLPSQYPSAGKIREGDELERLRAEELDSALIGLLRAVIVVSAIVATRSAAAKEFYTIEKEG